MLVTEKEAKLNQELRTFNSDLLSTVEKLQIGMSVANEMLYNEEKLQKAVEVLAKIKNLIKSFSIDVTRGEPKKICSLSPSFIGNKDLVNEKVFVAFIVLYMNRMMKLTHEFRELTKYQPFCDHRDSINRIVETYLYS